jgi:glycerate dehydrogenase
MELAGKTFGIVGLGNIGRRVAEIALAFGMKVKAMTSKSQDQLPAGIEKADLQTLLSSADVLSLHCPLTDKTRHLINADTLRQMKPTAILINTGRGPLIDDQTVADALQEGRLGAFCADVLTTEPPTSSNPLLTQTKAFITPHNAWESTEARIRLIQIATDNVRAFISDKPQNVV